MQLNKTEVHLFFSKDEAKSFIAEKEEGHYLIEHNLKEKEKYNQPYFIVKVKEEFDTEVAVMAQFKPEKGEKANV